MNHIEMTQSIWPGVSDDDAYRLLMNVTCYPFGPDERVFEQLREAHAASGGDVEEAVGWAHEITDRAMEEYKAKLATQEPSLAPALSYDREAQQEA